MRKATFKRICAYFLTLVMVLGMLPTTAFAAQVTVNLTGIGGRQNVTITVEGMAPVTATTTANGSNSTVAISVNSPKGKLLTVTSADGSLVGAAPITSNSNSSINVTMISVAEGLPINFFIAKPGSQPSATSTYAKYQPFNISQGSGSVKASAFLDPAVHNEIRNAPLEETITKYVETWPGERTAAEFKDFGQATFFNTKYSSDE